MARILRGHVCWASLDPVVKHEQAGHRPVLVLSPDEFNRALGCVIVVAISTKSRSDWPLEVRIPDGVLPRESWAKVGHVRNISINRLGETIGHVPASFVNQVVDALSAIIGEDAG